MGAKSERREPPDTRRSRGRRAGKEWNLRSAHAQAAFYRVPGAGVDGVDGGVGFCGAGVLGCGALPGVFVVVVPVDGLVILKASGTLARKNVAVVAKHPTQ
jgi:hypothetical protein